MLNLNPDHPPLRSLAMTGAGAIANNVRTFIDLVAAQGFRAIQLDAAHLQCRPRDMDRSARRDLASALRRSELELSGVDLLIPPEHYAGAATMDRALAAAGAALLFARQIADLAGGEVTLTTRIDAQADPSVVAELNNLAVKAGAKVGFAQWPPPESEAPAVGVAFDPAAVIAAGEDPMEALGRCGNDIVGARLTDLGPSGRVPPGAGRLDIASYRALLATLGRPRFLVMDLTGLPQPAQAIEHLANSW